MGHLNTLYAILPCYNEEENIGPLMESWLSQREALRQRGLDLVLLPIDDCSKDRTRGIMLDYAARYDQIRPLLHKENQGLGGGVRTGLGFFADTGGPDDLAVIMDGDNSHAPKYIGAMLDLLRADKLDCVIASRYRPGSATVGVSPFRQFLSFGARIYYSAMLRVKGVRDYTCGYRLYTHEIIKRAVDTHGDTLVEERGFSCMMEVLYKLNLLGAKFGEVPFELRYDQKLGDSKMQIGNTVSRSLTTAARLRKNRKRDQP